MKAAPTTLALTNPFPHAHAKGYDLDFASVHSSVVPVTEWRAPRFHFWVIDVASDRPMRQRIGGKETIRPPESVSLYAPNVTYEEFHEKGSLMRQAWLMFRVADHRSPLYKLVKPDGYCIFEDPGSLVRTLIGHIASYFLNPNPGADWFARSAFYQILALLRSAKGEPMRHICLPSLQLAREDKSLRSQVENYLHAHPEGRVTANAMAVHLGLGRSSFTHRYREEAGETFIQTKSRVRIERAKLMLVSERMPVKQIAAELGFSDAAHFSRVFHQIVGISPVIFKRQVMPQTRLGM